MNTTNACIVDESKNIEEFKKECNTLCEKICTKIQEVDNKVDNHEYMTSILRIFYRLNDLMNSVSDLTIDEYRVEIENLKINLNKLLDVRFILKDRDELDVKNGKKRFDRKSLVAAALAAMCAIMVYNSVSRINQVFDNNKNNVSTVCEKTLYFPAGKHFVTAYFANGEEILVPDGYDLIEVKSTESGIVLIYVNNKSVEVSGNVDYKKMLIGYDSFGKIVSEDNKELIIK